VRHRELIGGFSPPLVLTLTENAGSDRLFGQPVISGYFEALGLQPVKGRFFLPGEIRTPGSPPVAVLSFNAWKIRFHQDANIVGRTIEINETPFTIIGVALEGFLGVSAIFRPDAWLPATMAAQVLNVPMSVCVPEKSIVPCACATPGKASATNVGPISCAARSS